MVELDFSNIYSSTGRVIQIQYAQKAADAGITMIAMKNSKGAILLVSKPITSPLNVQESDHRIKKVSRNIYIASTGILSDGNFMTNICKRAASNYISQFQMDPSGEFLKRTLTDYLYMFTQYSSSRVLGANFLTIMRDGSQYKVFGADCSGKAVEYKAFSCGVGHRRAQTELEKIDFEENTIYDLIDAGIKTLFKCYDPLSDLKFNVEVGVISEDSNGEFFRMEQSKVDEIIEKYKDISIDGEEY